MGQEQIQEQRLAQQQKLAQSITQQQLLQAQLIELPITQLMERITAEMDDNLNIQITLRIKKLPLPIAMNRRSASRHSTQP